MSVSYYNTSGVPDSGISQDGRALAVLLRQRQQMINAGLLKAPGVQFCPVGSVPGPTNSHDPGGIDQALSALNSDGRFGGSAGSIPPVPADMPRDVIEGLA